MEMAVGRKGEVCRLTVFDEENQQEIQVKGEKKLRVES